MKTKLSSSKYDKYIIVKEEGVNRWPHLNNDLEFRYLFKFENGFGASVVKRYGTYGYDDDLFEVAMITFNNYGITTLFIDGYDLIYPEDTSFEYDVRGYCTEEQVFELLEEIKNYKP